MSKNTPKKRSRDKEPPRVKPKKRKEKEVSPIDQAFMDCVNIMKENTDTPPVAPIAPFAPVVPIPPVATSADDFFFSFISASSQNWLPQTKSWFQGQVMSILQRAQDFDIEARNACNGFSQQQNQQNPFYQ